MCLVVGVCGVGGVVVPVMVCVVAVVVCSPVPVVVGCGGVVVVWCAAARCSISEASRTTLSSAVVC